MNPLILTTRDGPITTVTLNRPEKRNALNIALLEQLGAAIAATEADASQRILIIRGAGPMFCSGLDLTEAAQLDVAHASAELIAQALSALSGTRLITIASVHGAAIAGGAGLISACDLAVATRDTKFGFPEVHRGLLPALIMTFLRRQLHERDMRELLFLGEPFSADRARAIGLINRVVPDTAALVPEIKTITTSLLKGAPEAVAQTKALLASLWPNSVVKDLERSLALHLSARNSAEAKEGIAAFMAKRPPNWVPSPPTSPRA